MPRSRGRCQRCLPWSLGGGPARAHTCRPQCRASPRAVTPPAFCPCPPSSAPRAPPRRAGRGTSRGSRHRRAKLAWRTGLSRPCPLRPPTRVVAHPVATGHPAPLGRIVPRAYRSTWGPTGAIVVMVCLAERELVRVLKGQPVGKVEVGAGPVVVEARPRCRLCVCHTRWRPLLAMQLTCTMRSTWCAAQAARPRAGACCSTPA